MTREISDRRKRRAPDVAPHLVDRLVALAEEGMASGIDHDFDIDAFVEEARAGPEPRAV